MIITLNPVKDTYVTNLNTQYNSGSLANVGHAATIDLFKLYNENKYSNAWVLFTFSDVIGKSKLNIRELINLGYYDSIQNKDKLDNIFLN